MENKIKGVGRIIQFKWFLSFNLEETMTTIS